ncbi:hypothetical protein LCGC14_2196480 [marine sediment metagenome]|uniref:Uncharacterized protein n=1 Tax=marine sediment metagenome TaxID=412755 RepID=A0A0F9DI14_9ZZZZ
MTNQETQDAIQSDRYAEIRAFVYAHEGMPDGAFFGMAEEVGIDIDDWDWYTDVSKHDPKSENHEPKK